MKFLECYYRKRRYNRIRSLRNAINAVRKEIKELDELAATYPQAVEQRDRRKADLTRMYSEISMMMTNYRLQYPKAKKEL